MALSDKINNLWLWQPFLLLRPEWNGLCVFVGFSASVSGEVTELLLKKLRLRWGTSCPETQLHLNHSINRPLSADRSPLSCQSQAGRENLRETGICVKRDSEKEQCVFWQEGSSKSKQFSLIISFTCWCVPWLRPGSTLQQHVVLLVFMCWPVTPAFCVGDLTSVALPSVLISAGSFSQTKLI